MQVKNQLEKYGFAIIPSIFGESEISELVSVVEPMLKNCPAAGIRGISQKLPTIQAFSNSPNILKLVTPILGAEARLVRSILFNKSPKVNWVASYPGTVGWFGEGIDKNHLKSNCQRCISKNSI